MTTCAATESRRLPSTTGSARFGKNCWKNIRNICTSRNRPEKLTQPDFCRPPDALRRRLCPSKRMPYPQPPPRSLHMQAVLRLLRHIFQNSSPSAPVRRSPVTSSWSPAARSSSNLQRILPYRSCGSWRLQGWDCHELSRPFLRRRGLPRLRIHRHAQVHRRPLRHRRAAVPDGSLFPCTLPLLRQARRPHQGAALGGRRLPASLQAAGRRSLPVAARCFRGEAHHAATAPKTSTAALAPLCSKQRKRLTIRRIPPDQIS